MSADAVPQGIFTLSGFNEEIEVINRGRRKVEKGIKKLAFFFIIVAVAITLTYIGSPLCFDYASYKVSSLKEIGGQTKRVASKYEKGYEFYQKRPDVDVKGYDFYQEKLSVRIGLSGYPGPIKEDVTKAIEYYSKVLGKSNPEFLKLFTHQLNFEGSGYLFALLFQGQLVPYLKKEAKPGDHVTIIEGGFRFQSGRKWELGG